MQQCEIKCKRMRFFVGARIARPLSRWAGGLPSAPTGLPRCFCRGRWQSSRDGKNVACPTGRFARRPCMNGERTRNARPYRYGGLSGCRGGLWPSASVKSFSIVIAYNEQMIFPCAAQIDISRTFRYTTITKLQNHAEVCSRCPLQAGARKNPFNPSC